MALLETQLHPVDDVESRYEVGGVSGRHVRSEDANVLGTPFDDYLVVALVSIYH